MSNYVHVSKRVGLTLLTISTAKGTVTAYLTDNEAKDLTGNIEHATYLPYVDSLPVIELSNPINEKE